MRLVDVNVLLYAFNTQAAAHRVAQRWLDDRLNGIERFGIPWDTALAFVRLGSNPRVLERAEAIDTLWALVRTWLSAPPVWIPLPTERHQQVLDTLISVTTNHRLVQDAHLAALAIEHGLILCTADRGFARFPGLRWENPLEARG